MKLWSAWMYSSGAMIAIMVLSLWIKPLYMPFVVFAFELALFVSVRHNRKKTSPGCYLLPFLVKRILFWSAIIMLIINVLHIGVIEGVLFEGSEINPEYPFIPILVLGPVATFVSGMTMNRHATLSFCRDCKMRHGTPAERGFLGVLFTQEGQYQNSFMTSISGAITLVTWGYYFVAYDNSEFSRHDEFFYIIIPVTLWILGAIYLALRYVGIWAYYTQRADEHQLQNGHTTTIRYMLFWDNYVGLLEPTSDPDTVMSVNTAYDTPAKFQLRYRTEVTLDEARHYFSALTHVDDADIRFMYSTIEGNPEGNIFHFIVFLNNEQKEKTDRQIPGMRWFTLREVSDLINTRCMAPLFSASFIRLHTIAKAWKTYDSNGQRRYAIRHYEPTFRICDIHKWDVDYNDKKWLYIANNNQDVPFFAFRRFWRKYISGATD